MYANKKGVLVKPKLLAIEHKTERIWIIDFVRGLACIAMFFFHFAYDLYVTGLVETSLTKNTLGLYFQYGILGSFVLISGFSFTLSTRSSGIKLNRFWARVSKLGLLAIGITIATYIVMPEVYVRFGVIHFFTFATLAALLFINMKKWVMILGILIVVTGVLITRDGLFPEPWLYMTGLMSERPPSIDYIPLIPWFGVFLIGMSLGHCNALRNMLAKFRRPNVSFVHAIIRLGRNALAFYAIHQLVIYAVLQGVASLIT